MGRSTSELFLRVNSALVLIALALALTYSSLEAFAVLISLFITAMAWEWGRLVRGKGFDLASSAQIVATMAAAWATARGEPAWALAGVAVGAAVVFAIRARGLPAPEAWWSAAGVAYAGLPAVALIWLRSDAQLGWLAILYIFAIVWTTDTAAYAFGRLIGGPRLAPRVSPKKTWSGLLGGVGSAGLVGMVFAAATLETGVVPVGLLGLALAFLAQIGDLGESAVKRAFGTKDSSSLIPGHGGVLDRIDGLVFVAVAAALLSWIVDPAHPGRALLIWS